MTEEVKDEEPKYVQIAIEKNERVYRFVIPDGSPLGEAFDASREASHHLALLAQKATEKPVEVEEEKEEE